MDKAHFFFMIAGISALAGVAIAAFNRPLKAVLNDGQVPQASGGVAPPAL